jgi:hypothetical protein
MSIPTCAVADKLQQLAGQLRPAERNNLRLLLCMAAGDLAPFAGECQDETRGSALRSTIAALARLQPYERQIPADGVVWQGRPVFLDDERLASLVAESHDRRPCARLYERQYLAPGGPRAAELAVAPEMVALVKEHAGPGITPTGVASYLFYDEPGMGIDPHVDTDVFALNAVLLLLHGHVGRPQSELVVFPTTGGRRSISLAAGELVLVYADSVVHGRTDTAHGENVHVLTIGFQPPFTVGRRFTM